METICIMAGRLLVLLLLVAIPFHGWRRAVRRHAEAERRWNEKVDELAAAALEQAVERIERRDHPDCAFRPRRRLGRLPRERLPRAPREKLHREGPYR